MFGSNAPSLPPPFAREHRPLPLTSDAAHPGPSGGCRYLLLLPSAQDKQCSCQFFHRNRNAPGNTCECGHQACYHVHENNENRRQNNTLNAVLEKLVEKVKRLEDTIQSERGNRETALQRERQMWEREVRILREALAPFYPSEKEMRRKIVEVEDRLEGALNDQLRLKEHVVALDATAVSSERRLEELEGGRAKRRRGARNNQVPKEPSQNDDFSPHNTARRVSSSIDEQSVHTPSSSSRALSPNAMGPPPLASSEPEEPRSSGILNLMKIPRSTPFHGMPRLSPPQDEARSSGFLNIDPAERPYPTGVSDQAQQVALHQAARITPPQDRGSPPSYANSNPELVHNGSTPPNVVSGNLKGPSFDGMVFPLNTSPRKRKYHLDRHTPLDVLADVTVASPLIH